MVRSGHVEYLPVPGVDGSPKEDPVELSQQEMRFEPAIAENAAESRFTHARNKGGVRYERIEIARDDDGSGGRIALGVAEDLIQLIEPELFRPLAFEMEVVNDKGLVAGIEFRNQRDAATFPALQHRNSGDKQPPGLPPPGLMFETQQTRGFDRERGEKSLTLERRIFRGALAQFLEFRPENVIHAERFGELPGDVDSMGAARAKIDLLKDSEIRVEPTDLLLDVFEVLAAIYIPVQNGGALAGGARLSVGRPGVFPR